VTVVIPAVIAGLRIPNTGAMIVRVAGVKFKVRRVTAILVAPSFEGFARSRHHKHQDDHEHERPDNE
jgi:hypothetical protein